jgi:hypothetical protein
MRKERGSVHEKDDVLHVLYDVLCQTYMYIRIIFWTSF